MEEADELNEILAKELHDSQQEGMSEEKEVKYFKEEIESINRLIKSTRK